MHLVTLGLCECKSACVCVCTRTATIYCLQRHTFRSCFTHIFSSFIFFLRTAFDFPSRFLFFQLRRKFFYEITFKFTFYFKLIAKMSDLMCRGFYWNVTHKRISKHWAQWVCSAPMQWHKPSPYPFQWITKIKTLVDRARDWYRKLFERVFPAFISWARCMFCKILGKNNFSVFLSQLSKTTSCYHLLKHFISQFLFSGIWTIHQIRSIGQ